MNSEAHNNADALKRHLTKEVLESLYKETKIRPDLVREVMMGPFKHTIDDGLEIRKVKLLTDKNFIKKTLRLRLNVCTLFWILVITKLTWILYWITLKTVTMTTTTSNS